MEWKKKQMNFSSCDSFDALLQNGRTLHADQAITRLVTMHGNPITSVDSINDDFIGLAAKEQFYWPLKWVGYTTTVEMDGRSIGIRTRSLKPRVFELINLVSPDECDSMVEHAKKLSLKKSTIGETAELGVYDNVIRTSTNTWVGPTSRTSTEVYDKVTKRILDLTKLSSDTAEDMQVVHYGIGEHFFVHHDYNDPNNCATGYCRGGGNRLVTVLFYLNDVDEGGETTFPYSNNTKYDPYKLPIPYSSKCGEGGLWVQPKKGHALMFYSLLEKGHMDGRVDPYSLHAGCDVVKGEKWAANLWIRNKRVNGKLIDDNW